MGDEPGTTQCLDCGQNTRLKKLTGKKTKPPLAHKTHHLHSLAKFLLQSYTMLSMGASQKEHLQSYHGSRSIDMSAGDARFIGSKTHLFIYLEAIWSFGNAVFTVFQ